MRSAEMVLLLCQQMFDLKGAVTEFRMRSEFGPMSIRSIGE